jgi:hypothetical protein
MAKLKATPKSYAEAAEYLAGRDLVKLGNNTSLECTGADPVRDFIGVRLHSTFIVKFWRDGQVTLHSGGYRTVTTKSRMNQFIKGRVYAYKHQWYYRLPHQTGDTGVADVIFSEGVDVS